MPSLQKKGNGWYCQFLYHGKRHTVSIGQVSETEAQAKSDQMNYLLMRLRQRLIELPPGVDIREFLQRDGQVSARGIDTPQTGELNLGDFRDRYLATNRNSQEKRSIDGIELHFKHLAGALGERFPIRELKLAHLQDYIEGRGKAKGMYGRRLSPATIKKEIITLRTAWNWAAKRGLVTGRFPNDGLLYPKEDEKPQFMTRAEIERQIAAGGLTGAQQKDLWNALFLTLAEVAEMLDHLRDVRDAAVGLPDGLLCRAFRCPAI